MVRTVDETSTTTRTADPGAIEEEARQLAALLRANDPGMNFEPLVLPESDPVRVRAFWRAVGWSPDWPRRRLLHRPEMPADPNEMARLLDQVRDDAPHAAVLEEGALPERFRLVHVDASGIGFSFTDEDDEPTREDPPVKSVVFEVGEVSPLAPSYLAWCASEIVHGAFASWFQVRAKGVAPELFAGVEAPFPTLSPGTRRLSDGLWALPTTLPGSLPPGARQLAYTRPEDLARWLQSLPPAHRPIVPPHRR
jgi:hypothetical protein